MNSPRPGLLSIRAINQYRHRDIFAYLGLRYYLNSAAAQTDRWAREVASHLVLSRSSPPHLRVRHFKELEKDGTLQHREMCIPGPNEALAEAALLAECAAHPDGFANPEGVFSYVLARTGEDLGVFRPYFKGLKSRHSAIADACDVNSDGIVRYLDIKRFYPSITTELAVQVWHRSAERGRLSKHWLELGDKLIADQGQTCGSEEKGVLTGPMLSHLLGNLVLRNLDERFAVHLPAGYFRYVDDITLVGSRSEVTRAVDTVRTELGELGFETHDDESDKSIEVTTTEWLMGRDDYAASGTQVSWKAFIGNLKRWLLIHPDETQQMRSMLRDRGFRVPVLDYSMAVKHRGYLMRLMELARHHWVRLKTMKIKPRTLMHLGDTLRDKYFREFESILRMLDGADRFTRKRMVPKLRYRASRLICLATEDQLRSLAEAALGIPELHHHGRVMEAVATGNVRAALGLGTDTAQAVAQTLVAAGKEAQVGGSALSDLERQSLAVLALNGVVLRGVPHETQAGGELWQFALNGVDRSLMKSEDPFMREVACLHGLSDEPRHSFMLSNAYDEDEVLAMDAVDQLQQSMSE